MIHGSLFTGIGGFDLACELAGIETKWQVEIDKSCQIVLRNHFPGVTIYDDIRTVGGHNLAPVDIITFGSPCQDLSVAGKRKGMAGERSGLYYEAIRIIRVVKPRYAIWENVPGALSSNGGRDFGAALDALAESGALDIGWAILDAQWFGVPQRRRRVFVVADFRGKRAKEILSIPSRVCRDTPPRRKVGEDVAYSIRANPSHSGDKGDGGVNTTLVAGNRGWRSGAETDFIPIAFNWQDGQNFKAGHNTNPIRSCQTEAVCWHNKHSLNQLTGTGGNQVPMVGVRRLTPLECERLQGFPDFWTAQCSDSVRYRMIGNAVAVPVVEWIMRRIVLLRARDRLAGVLI